MPEIDDEFAGNDREVLKTSRDSIIMSETEGTIHGRKVSNNSDNCSKAGVSIFPYCNGDCLMIPHGYDKHS